MCTARVGVAAKRPGTPSFSCAVDRFCARLVTLQQPGGGIARAPCLLPYVDPHARASIADVHGFSRALWRLNAELFEGTGLCIADLPAPAGSLFGQPEQAPLSAPCRWHLERLEALR